MNNALVGPVPEKRHAAASVSIVVLAAGQSTRMKELGHKLLARFDGVTLIRKSVLAAVSCDSCSVVVVSGEMYRDLEDTLVDLDARVVRNLQHASGMASSIRVGVTAAQDDKPDGILIFLADMPKIGAMELDLLIAAFREHHCERIVRAVADGKPGNPVIFPSAWFERLKNLCGDFGARALLKAITAEIVDVEIGDAALIDVDTPQDLMAAGGIPSHANG